MKTIVTVTCPVCHGNKKVISDGMMSIDCSYCDGKGEVKAATQDSDTNGNAIKCPTCHGCGKVWEDISPAVNNIIEQPFVVEPLVVKPELTTTVLRRRGRPKKIV